jgi:hypothetical protein
MRFALQTPTQLAVMLVAALFVFSILGCSDQSHEIVQPEGEFQSPLTPAENVDLTRRATETPQHADRNIAASPGANNWHNLSDGARNNLILSTAYGYLGTKFTPNPPLRGQCKYFADNDVVQVASGGLVDLPPNNTNQGQFGYLAEWVNDYWDANLQIVSKNQSFASFSFIQPGQIIQMRWGNNNPHTAIVDWVSPNQIGVIDANWVAPLTVGTHSISLSWWTSNVQAFTIYQIK